MFQKELVEIGERIEMLRKEKGWTQEMLAEKLNISRNTLAKLEGGFRDFKSTEIINIAKVLGVSTDFLLGVSPHRDISSRMVTASELGLSEKAIKVITYWQQTGYLTKILNLLLEQEVPDFEGAGFEIPSSMTPEDTERVAAEVHFEEWGNVNDSYPVLFLISRYLRAEVTPDLMYDITPRGSIEPPLRGLRVRDTVAQVNAADIIDNVLLSKIESCLKGLKGIRRKT